MGSEQHKISRIFPAKKYDDSGNKKAPVSQPSAGKINPLKEQFASTDDVIEELLRKFDLSSKFGPCIGITRMERWTRAEELGLNPPPEVYTALRSVIRDNSEKCKQSLCLWEGRV
jgi:hypothetical protein